MSIWAGSSKASETFLSCPNPPSAVDSNVVAIPKDDVGSQQLSPNAGQRQQVRNRIAARQDRRHAQLPRRANTIAMASKEASADWCARARIRRRASAGYASSG